MSPASPPRRRKKPRDPDARRTGETPTADAATVAWTLATSTALLCDLAAVAGHLIAVNRPDAPGPAMFRELMLFSAAVSGLATLILTPLVYRVRRTPPPTGFTIFAVCVAVAPMLAIALRALR